jgi:hypothetical protein
MYQAKRSGKGSYRYFELATLNDMDAGAATVETERQREP